jgi:hypothetical protein
LRPRRLGGPADGRLGAGSNPCAPTPSAFSSCARNVVGRAGTQARRTGIVFEPRRRAARGSRAASDLEHRGFELLDPVPPGRARRSRRRARGQREAFGAGVRGVIGTAEARPGDAGAPIAHATKKKRLCVSAWIAARGSSLGPNASARRPRRRVGRAAITGGRTGAGTSRR